MRTAALFIGLAFLSQGCSFGIDPFAQALRDHNEQAASSASKDVVDPDYIVQYRTSWYYAPAPILVVAAYEGNVEAVNALLEKGANVNASVGDIPFRYWPGGLTALHAAADIGDSTIVKMLLARGANPNARVRSMFGTPEPLELRTLKGLTPLMVAAIRGNTEVVEVLLQGGASTTDQEITKGRTPRELAEGIGSAHTAWLIRLAELRALYAPEAHTTPIADNLSMPMRSSEEKHCHLAVPLQRISFNGTLLGMASDYEVNRSRFPIVLSGWRCQG